MNQSIVIVNNLSKKYNEVYAVNDISFKVNKGEIFGLLGPNGAGKTTTVEILEGLISPDSGEAIIDGIDAIKNTKKILSQSIRLGGASIKDFFSSNGKKGLFQQHFKAYAREGKSCSNIDCNEKIIRSVISNRSSFYCLGCQK